MRAQAALIALSYAVAAASTGAASAAGATGVASPPAPQPTLAVLDIELSGDLGGPEFSAEHAQRLKTESELLRQQLQQSGKYQLADLTPAQPLIEQLKSSQAYLHDCNGCDLDVGRAVKAQKVMVTWVNRVSGLILTLTYEIHDVASGQIDMRKSYDFRGDNDNAWSHAVRYMVRDLTEG